MELQTNPQDFARCELHTNAFMTHMLVNFCSCYVGLKVIVFVLPWLALLLLPFGYVFFSFSMLCLLFFTMLTLFNLKTLSLFI